MTTLRQLLNNSRERLTSIYGAGETEWLLRTVMEHVKGWDRVELVLRADKEVSDFTIERVNEAVDRLVAGEPVQYIYGDTYWYGMQLKVTPNVLIPRPETEELVDLIVKDNPQSDLHVLDVCTGSGCIAVALAKTLKFPEVSAIDISEAALKIASENASIQKVKIDLRKTDALALPDLKDEYDIIVSNPPYVMESEKKGMDKNVLDHEPHIALFVPDSDPLKFYTAIADFAINALKDNGRIYFELNPLTADTLADNMRKQGWNDVQLLPDMHTRIRFLTARK
ncbi:MAG: peptide chain release factor N(5)-glutamine methyltransferase [Duncaniella sp.]|uniref:peptide chain release factor N(5)-glutamine methyltransferase n=1 Tax=Duncaniella sp. TaxID=2518496 RepID=UPI0023C92E30|nr:peptide chain release factor N(5)-glutamine methyltransferase [Duncaniella sp.]MDE6090946.1 peptide chain release factor N(5)-glutamine methyltransferase [Duncaniella sp.]